MRDLLDYPLGAVRSAFRTIVGWTAVMAITSIGGFMVGRCIEKGSLHPLGQILTVALSLTFAAIFYPPVLGASIATALGWSLGLNFESLRFRIVIVVVNSALWAAVGVWARL